MTRVRRPPPSADPPGPPPTGGPWALRFTDARAQTVTLVIRRRNAAERHAEVVRRLGGAASLWTVTLPPWRAIDGDRRDAAVVSDSGFLGGCCPPDPGVGKSLPSEC
jgi:hypothetical protein